MSNWKQSEYYEKIKDLLRQVPSLYIGYNHYEGRSSSVEKCKLQNADLVLGYIVDLNLYVAWNAGVHRLLRPSAFSHTFSISKNCLKEASPYTMRPVYRPLEKTLEGYNPSVQYYEKMVLIGSGCIIAFCQDPYRYMAPNRLDDGYCKNTIYYTGREYITEDFDLSPVFRTEQERSRYTCSRVSRDARFRKSVLEKYHNKCAVCGLDIKEALQAAHIQPVSDDGSDDIENGICLCANHHLMFDHGLLKFDRQNKPYSDIEKIQEHLKKCSCEK